MMACSLAHSPYLPPVDAVQHVSGDKKMIEHLSSGVYDGLFHKVEGLLDPSVVIVTVAIITVLLVNDNLRCKTTNLSTYFDHCINHTHVDLIFS